MYARVIWEEWGETVYKQQATGGGETLGKVRICG